MNSYERTMYWLYKKNNPDMKISKRRSGVGNVRESILKKSEASKADFKWEVCNLYYERV